jgi:two-component system alkaline phosphatase synthesis response regulator PhoP
MIAEPISLLSAPKFDPLPSRPNSRQRILVVEDERKLREQTAEELTDAGYQVDVAEDGAAAWSALRVSKYDLVITDQFMPKVTGVQLLKKMQAARMTLPVIMATGFLPTWEFTLHTWLQPVKMLLKPYSLEELLDVVESVLPRTTGAVSLQESGGPSVVAMGRGAGC